MILNEKHYITISYEPLTYWKVHNCKKFHALLKAKNCIKQPTLQYKATVWYGFMLSFPNIINMIQHRNIQFVKTQPGFFVWIGRYIDIDYL